MWLLLCILPLREPVTDHVDVTEINYFHDDCGKLVFAQVIWWRWMRWDGQSGYRVAAWRMMAHTGYPIYDHESREWVTNWFDQKTSTVREVRSKIFRVTVTLYDREIYDRDVLPECKRRGLKP